jgi:conjugal transfer/entry exclusion protein
MTVPQQTRCCCYCFVWHTAQRTWKGSVQDAHDTMQAGWRDEETQRRKCHAQTQWRQLRVRGLGQLQAGVQLAALQHWHHNCLATCMHMLISQVCAEGLRLHAQQSHAHILAGEYQQLPDPTTTAQGGSHIMKTHTTAPATAPPSASSAVSRFSSM